MTDGSFSIAGRKVGAGYPYVIAEIGINHGGNVEVAKKLVRAAKDCGVDAAKLQAFIPKKFLARSSPYYDLLASCALDRSAFGELMALARDIGLTLFSAVFDEESADILHEADAPAFKIASGDLTHLPLLRHVARFGRPMLISTGGATMAETRAALEAVRSVDAAIPIALFHCVSNYPTEAKDSNLACMATMRAEFRVPVGFSDHTLGLAVPIAAAAQGAELIEKHFTLDRAADGPDHALSLDPAGMTALVESVKTAYESIGRTAKMPVEEPDAILQIRRSLVAARDIPAGAVIQASMVEAKRPGTGIPPDDIRKIVGRKTARAIAADTPLAWADVI
jgi:N,N'-diacetyllegionaminate synthase